MCDRKEVPSLFFSKNYLPESVKLFNLDKDKPNKFYWMLSIASNKRNDTNKISNNNFQLAPYDDNDSEMIDCCDIEDNYEISATKSGKYITSFYVPMAMHAAIVGPKGSTLRMIQENTGALIKVPKPIDKSGIIKISGPTERIVASARTRVALIVLIRREKMQITHFVSVPVISDEIINNFLIFKDSILKGPATRGIDESIFQKPEKFHLTIVTLRLLDQKEIEEAKTILTNFHESIKKLINNKKLTISLNGLEIMNDDPSDTHILYGNVNFIKSENNEMFQTLADEIMICFYKNGFVKKQYEKVKLHVTLMNSIFRKSDDYEKVHVKFMGKRESFDSTEILEKYKNYYFGTTNFNNIQLSIRFSTTKDGYYNSLITLNV